MAHLATVAALDTGPVLGLRAFLPEMTLFVARVPVSNARKDGDGKTDQLSHLMMSHSLAM
jgi:hypothetical protein